MTAATFPAGFLTWAEQHRTANPRRELPGEGTIRTHLTALGIPGDAKKLARELKAHYRAQGGSAVATIADQDALTHLPEEKPAPCAVDDDQPVIYGVTPGTKLHRASADEIKARLLAQQERMERMRAAKNTQRITFRRGPIAIAHMSDQHIGSEGCDYRRMYADAELVARTPGMYAISGGDESNNMIVGKLERVRREAPITISEEDEAVRAYWEILGESLLAITLGNHNGWAYGASGRDPFFGIAPKHVLIDPHEVKFSLEVGGRSLRYCIRHKVRSGSIYNNQHGNKQHVRLREDFDVFVSAHVHRGATFEVWYDRGERKISGVTGTYKVVDSFEMQEGFLGGGKGAALCFVFDEQGTPYPFDDIEIAADFLAFLRRRA